jgi:hypothetical protein
MMRELGLVGGAVVAIDGAFFDGNASKASIKTQRKLARQLAKIDQEIEAYGATLEANDSAEAEHSPAGPDGNVGEKVAALMAKRANVQADLARLEESGQTQPSHTPGEPANRCCLCSALGRPPATPNNAVGSPLQTDCP